MKQFLKHFFLTLGLIAIANLFFISCQKDGDEPDQPARPLLNTMSSYKEDGTLDYVETYHYDDKDRLVEMINSEGYKVLLEYTPTKVTIKEFDNDEMEYLAAYNLNSQSLCVSSVAEEDEVSSYTYDTNGYRKTSLEEDSNSSYAQTFTVVNGNYVTINTQMTYLTAASTKLSQHGLIGMLAKIKTLDKGVANQNILKSAADNTYSYRSDFSFYTDHTNTIEFENMGIYFFGKQNNNPIKQEVRTASDGIQYKMEYTCEYDSKGRIVKHTFENDAYDVYTYID